MLSELADIRGVSGDEVEVRRFIMKKLAGTGIELSVDTMGNLIARKNRGRLEQPPMLWIIDHGFGDASLLGRNEQKENEKIDQIIRIPA